MLTHVFDLIIAMCTTVMRIERHVIKIHVYTYLIFGAFVAVFTVILIGRFIF